MGKIINKEILEKDIKLEKKIGVLNEENKKLKQQLKGMQQAMAELSAMATLVAMPKE